MAELDRKQIVQDLLQAGWRLGIKPKPTPRSAPKGAPPSGKPLTVREIHDLVRSKPARPRVVGSASTLWQAEHEAGHAALAHGLGWNVESIEIGANGGKVVSYPPERLADDPRQQRKEESVIQAAGVASTGAQYSPGTEEDRFQVRSLAYMSFEDAQASATRALADPWVRKVHHLLIDALMEHGKLEGAELQRVLAEAD